MKTYKITYKVESTCAVDITAPSMEAALEQYHRCWVNGSTEDLCLDPFVTEFDGRVEYHMMETYNDVDIEEVEDEYNV